jgi:hypothetical protein
MAFDITSLLSTTFEDAFSTETKPCPEGEYTAMVEKIELKPVTAQGEEKVILKIVWTPQDSDGRIKQATGRDKINVSQDLWLDLTPEMNLDGADGMNIPLGKVRKALGQNTKGKAWGFGQMVGNVAKIMVTHRTAKDGKVYAEVKSVLAL